MRVKILAYGKVQGVFFRAHTQRKAQSLGIKGWVKNRDDGSVEILADSSEDKIKKLIEWLREEGSPSSNVQLIETEEIKNSRKKLSGFEIKL